MDLDLRLHYAPDNASLCVRLALGALALPFETVLVDRSRAGQRDPSFLALNPNGLIPVLETPDGPLYETGAILLWLEDQHPGRVFPAVGDRARGPALVWLMWLANTLHPALQMLFYPDTYFAADPEGLRDQTRLRVRRMLAQLDDQAPTFLTATSPTMTGCYLAPMLRWMALYGGDTSWFDLQATPRLDDFAHRFEQFPIARDAAAAEGLGTTPFSAPSPAQPPEGSAL